jgi:hypothetical protein
MAIKLQKLTAAEQEAIENRSSVAERYHSSAQTVSV